MLTREEILAMEACPQLEVAILLAFNIKQKWPDRSNDSMSLWLIDGKLLATNTFCPALDISDAWGLWKHCLEKFGPDAWARALRPAIRLRDCDYSTVGALSIVVEHLTPLAICKGALIAHLENCPALPIEKETKP